MTNLIPIANVAAIASLLLLALQVFRPWVRPGRNRVIHRERLSLLGRLRLFGLPGALLLAVSAVGWWAGVLSAVVFDLLVLGVAGLLAMPVAYTLTPQGIALGRTPPRRWTEFGGVSRQRWGVRLQGVAGGRGMRVWLSGGRDDDAFVLLLRRLVRGSYQGWVDPAPEAASVAAGFDGLPGNTAAVTS